MKFCLFFNLFIYLHYIYNYLDYIICIYIYVYKLFYITIYLSISNLSHLHLFIYFLYRSYGWFILGKVLFTFWHSRVVKKGGRLSPQATLKPATTNARRLGSVKNCPSKNVVTVGPYLAYHDHLVLKGVLKHIYTYATFVWPLRLKTWKEIIFWLELYILNTIFYTDNFSRYLIVGHLS